MPNSISSGSLGEQILGLLPSMPALYHRWILVVAPGGGGKSAALRSVQQRTGARLVNLNLELSRRLVELTARQRKLQASRLVGELVAQAVAQKDMSGVMLLDNTEILFDVSLAIDPLRLLGDVSRNWTLVVAWRGRADGEHLVYALPGHPEYRRYPISDLMIVTPRDATAVE
jgi:hypothetical protein